MGDSSAGAKEVFGYGEEDKCEKILALTEGQAHELLHAGNFFGRIILDCSAENN